MLDWDTATGDGTVTGGSGAWDLAALGWTANGGAANLAWDNAGVHSAVFGGPGGTVTLSTGIVVGNLTFNSPGYLVEGETLTLSGGAVSLEINGDTTINSSLNGTGFTKTGAGTLTLSGANGNTYAGTVTVGAGELVLNKLLDGGLTGDVVVNAGAVLRLMANQQLSDFGLATINGTLNMAGHVDAIGGLQGGGMVTDLNSNTGDFTILPLAGGTYTFAGTLSGSGTGQSANSTVLRVMGSGTQVFTGTVSLPNGTVAVSSNIGAGISFEGNAVATVKGIGLGLAAFGSDGMVRVADNARLTIGSSGIGVGTGSVGMMVGGGTGRTQLIAGAAGTWNGPMFFTDSTEGSPIVDTGANAVTISGAISGAGGLLKRGNGVLTLTGGTSLSDITIEGGSIVFLTGFDQRDALGLVGALTIKSGATAVLGNGNANGPGVNNFNTFHGINILGGTLNVLDRTDIGLISMTGGEIKGAAGAGNPGRLWIRELGIVINPSPATALINTGNLAIAAVNTTFNVGDGAAEPDLSVTSAILQDVAGRGLIKSGDGSMTLSSTSTYSGPTSINGGRLSLAGGSLANTAITVATGATFQAAPGTFAGTTVAGTAGATLTLNAGTFSMAGDNAVGTFSLNQNVSFAGSALTLDGATLKFDLSSAGADRLAVTKTGSYAGINSIDVTAFGGFLFNGTYDLITTSAFNSAGGSFQFLDGNPTKMVTLGATTYTLSLETTATAQRVVVSGGFDPLATAYWTGVTSGTWNALAPTNWATDVGGTAAVVYPSSVSNVVFSATGGGANLSTTLGENFSIQSLTFSSTADAAHAVTIGGTHSLRIGAGGITVASGSGAHTITTSGGVLLGASQTWTNNSTSSLLITSSVANAPGATSNLTVAGTGRVILAGAGSYAATTINAGATLQVGNGGTTGTFGTATVTINGTLDLNRSDAVTLANVFSGAGTITKTGNGTLTLTGGSSASSMVLSAGTTIFTTGFAGQDALGVNGVLTVNSGATAQLGTGTTNGAGVNNFRINSQFNIVGGTIDVRDRTDIGLITMTGGLIKGSAGAGDLGRLWLRAPGITVVPHTSTAVISTGNLALAENTILNIGDGAADPDLTISSVITQNAQAWGISKSGNGHLLLTGASVYTGPTTFNSGLTTLGTGGSLGNTAITVNSGATFRPLAGTFAGNASIAGAGATLTMSLGSILDMSGDNAIGTFNVNQNAGFVNNAMALDGATLRFDLNSGGLDRLAVNSTGTYAGINTIDIVPSGSLFFAGTYDLISTSLLTAIPGGVFQFPDGSTVKNMVVGPITYTLTLQSTATAQQLAVTGGPTPISIGYWTGATSSVWNAVTPASNWATDAAGTPALIFPSAGTDVFFSATGGGANRNTTLGENFSIRSLTFTDAADATHAVSVGGSHVLTLGEGGLQVAFGSGAHTIANGGVVLGTAQTWTNDSASPLLVSAPVTGSDLTISGIGKITLGADNNYAATTVNLGATLEIGTGGTTGTTGLGAVTSFGTLILNRGDATTLASTIGGNGRLIKDGAGTLTYTGGSTLLDMTLQAGTTIFLTGFDTRDALGAGGTLTVNAGAIAQLGDGTTGPGVNNFSDDRQFFINGGLMDVRDRTDVGLIIMSGGTITGTSGTGVAGRLWIRTAGFDINAAPTTATISTGNLMLVTATTFDVEDGPASPDLTVSSVIQQATVGLGFTKVGTGTMRIAAVDTYTGITALLGGKLEVALGGSISGSQVEVFDTATLAGTGTTGSVNLQPGGTLAPGLDGLGTLATGAVNFLGDSKFAVEIAGAGSDLLSASDSVTLFGVVSLEIDFLSAPQNQTTFTVVNSSLGILGYDLGGRFSYDGTVLSEGSQFTVMSGAWSQDFTISYFADGGTDVTLFSVPEPGSVAILLGGLCTLAACRWRRA